MSLCYTWSPSLIWITIFREDLKIGVIKMSYYWSKKFAWVKYDLTIPRKWVRISISTCVSNRLNFLLSFFSLSSQSLSHISRFLSDQEDQDKRRYLELLKRQQQLARRQTSTITQRELPTAHLLFGPPPACRLPALEVHFVSQWRCCSSRLFVAALAHAVCKNFFPMKRWKKLLLGNLDNNGLFPAA